MSSKTVYMKCYDIGIANDIESFVSKNASDYIIKDLDFEYDENTNNVNLRWEPKLESEEFEKALEVECNEINRYLKMKLNCVVADSISTSQFEYYNAPFEVNLNC